MSVVAIKVPALGESVKEAVIAAWKRGEGDAVKIDEPLCEVESEKATVEIPSPAAGSLARILRRAGETVAVGEVIAELEVGERAAAPGAASRESQKVPVLGAPAGGGGAPAVTGPRDSQRLTAVIVTPTSAPAATTGNGRSGADGHEAHLSPALRRMLAERGLTAADVAGSGPGGRVLREDVLRAVESDAGTPVATPAARSPVAGAPAPSPPAPGAVAPRDPRERVVPMTPLRRTVARRLVEAQHNAAILTTFNEINMAEVIALRERYQEPFQKRHGVKLGFMSFFVKAAVNALKAYPAVNAEIRGADIVYKDFFDIGIAVGGGRGLVVPVVRDADRLPLHEIERAISELAARARDNKLAPRDLEGGTFTISNGGIYGSMMSTPILNPPQSGILGLHAIQKRPVAVGEAIALRPMMYVALSYDHRIIDGREAVQFLIRVKECLEDPERILIDV